MYKNTKISFEEAEKLRNDKNWISYCENHHGGCYWNKETGEIMWISNNGINDNMERLIKK